MTAARDIGTQEFPTAVLARSREVPVVVDFWAPWCGPCRVLGPLLEREVAALGGKVEMVKVNTDENPDLATAFQIQGIPAVKAFVDGRVAAEFVGAQGLEAVRSFLARLVPSEASVALGEARALLVSGDAAASAKAETTLRSLLGDREVGDDAAWELARWLVGAGRAGEAEDALARLEGGPHAEKATALRRLASFAAEAAAYGGLEKARADLATDGKNWEARYALACALASSGDFGGALEQLLEIVSRQRKFRNDGARLAMLALFEHLGADSELVQHYRRQLQIVT